MFHLVNIIEMFHSGLVDRVNAQSETDNDSGPSCVLWSDRDTKIHHDDILPRANWAIQWPLNHVGVNVRRYRPINAPAGKNNKNPTTQKIA